jgi:hypothetical protein
MAGGGSPSSVAVALTSTPVVSASEDRTLLVISAPAANRVSLSPGAAAVDLTGIVVYSGQGPVILSRKLHGPLVGMAWYGIAAVAGQTIGVLEGFGS